MPLQVLKEMSGNSAVVAYAALTLHKGTGSPYVDLYVIAIGVVMFLATMACTQLVDRAGRRPLLLASCGLSAVSLSAAGLYFFLKVRNAVAAVEDCSLFPCRTCSVGGKSGSAPVGGQESYSAL